MENKILNILRKYEGFYEHKIYNSSFEDIAKEISIEIKLMTAELQAKVYTYEKIIANSNFKPILQEEIESNVNDDIEFGVLKALNTDLEDDVEMG